GRGANDANQRSHAERHAPRAERGCERPAGAHEERLQIGVHPVRRRLEENAPVPVVIHATPSSRRAHRTSLTTTRWVSDQRCPIVDHSGQYTAGSPLSVGLATTFLKASLIGTFRLSPLGGVGWRVQLSEFRCIVTL